MVPTIPAFGETNFTDLQSTKSTRVVNICDVDKKAFSDYCQLFANSGCIEKEKREQECFTYAAYAFEGWGIFLNYYDNLRELNIVMEENTPYFAFNDCAGEFKVAPQITQIALEDYGMSYAIRLSDGRFVMIDGGTNFVPDTEYLMEFLGKNSPYEKPVVAAWFFTHPDCDHFFLFNDFMDNYADDVVVQKIIMNFPDVDSPNYSQLMAVVRIGNNGDGVTQNEHYHRLLQHIEKQGICLFVPRCGQIYRIGDAAFEIFSCQDNIPRETRKFNSISLIFRMELAGQTALWTGDAHMDEARMLLRFGNYLKSDFMQIPHHGFNAGDSDIAIASYETIKPSVCFLPGSTQESFCDFSTYVPQVEYIFTKLGVDEVISGTPQRTLTLPYMPSPNAKKELERVYRKGRECSGANMWVFTGLNTGRKEDFRFSVLNTTYMPAKVSVELYFEDKKAAVHDIRFTAQPLTCKEVCIVDEKDVDIRARVLDRDTLAVKGYPENAPFAVRFMCETPIIVSHADHMPAYHTTNA